MKQRLFIYGAGGLGREMLSFLRDSDQWEPAGFIDDQLPVGTEVDGLPVAGGADFLNNRPERTAVIISIGNPGRKAAVIHTITNEQIFYPIIIHPNALLQDPSRIVLGPGCIVTAGVVITTGVTIGSHVLLNLNVTVGHDAVIGEYVSMMPGVNVSGNVTICQGAFVGSGANIRNYVNVGAWSTVGMGAVVIRDVAENDRVAGVPARSLTPREL
jgi:sugar O-acyltransferase (sialic acid O-acetyltransferase NeuD family)